MPAPLVPPTPPVPAAAEDAEYPLSSPYTLAQWRAAARMHYLSHLIRAYLISAIGYALMCGPVQGIVMGLLGSSLPMLALFVLGGVMIAGLLVTMFIPQPMRTHVAVVMLIATGVMLMGAAIASYLGVISHGKEFVLMLFVFGLQPFTSAFAIREQQKLHGMPKPVPVELQRELAALQRRALRPEAQDRDAVIGFTGHNRRVRLLNVRWAALLLDGYALVATRRGSLLLFVRREELSIQPIEPGETVTTVTITIAPQTHLDGTIGNEDMARYQRWMGTHPAREQL
jgi:hypothetical protein